MKTNISNILLVLSGTVLVAWGLFRQFPLKIDKTFLWNVGPLAVMFTIIGVLVCTHNQIIITPTGRTSVIQNGIDGTMLTSMRFFFTVLLLMPLIGFSSALTPVFQKQIENLLSGWGGWFWVLPLSFTAPGGSGYAGVIVELWKTSHLRPLILYLLNVTTLVAFSIFQIRSLGLGPEIALRMYAMNWVAAIWTLPLYLAYWKFFFVE